MSEAEMIVEGIVCEVCAEVIDGESVGFPRKCAECEEEED